MRYVIKPTKIQPFGADAIPSQVTDYIPSLVGLDKKRPLFAVFSFGAPPGTRTLDPLIKSQLLYQLS